MEQLKVTESKTVAVGQKMDLVFYTLQLGFFYMDFDRSCQILPNSKLKIANSKGMQCTMKQLNESH